MSGAKENLTLKKQGEQVRQNELQKELGVLSSLNELNIRPTDEAMIGPGVVYEGPMELGKMDVFVPSDQWKKPHGLSTEQVSVVFDVDSERLKKHGLRVSDIAELHLSNEKLGTGINIGPEVECNVEPIINERGSRKMDHNVRFFRSEDQIEVHANDLEVAPPPAKDFVDFQQIVKDTVRRLVIDGYNEQVRVNLGGTRFGFYDPRETEVSPNGMYNSWIAQKLSILTREAVPNLDDKVSQNLTNFAKRMGYKDMSEFVSGNDFQQWDISAGHFSIDLMSFEGYTLPEEKINLVNATSYFSNILKAVNYSGGRMGAIQMKIDGKPVASAREIARNISSTASASIPPLLIENMEMNRNRGIIDGYAPIPDRSVVKTVQGHFGGHSDVRIRDSMNLGKLRNMNYDFKKRKGERIEFTGLDASFAKLNDYFRSVALANVIVLGNRIAMSEGYDSEDQNFFDWMADNGIGRNIKYELYNYATSSTPLKERNRLLVGQPDVHDMKKLEELERLIYTVEEKMNQRINNGLNPDFDLGIIELAKAGAKGLRNDWELTKKIGEVGPDIAIRSYYKDQRIVDLKWFNRYVNDPESVCFGRLLANMPSYMKELIIREAQSSFKLPNRIPSQENINKLLKNYPHVNLKPEEVYTGELDIELAQIAAILSTNKI